MIAALTADWLFGEPRRWHPLVGFGILAQALEHRLYPKEAGSQLASRRAGALAWLIVAVLPAALLLLLIERLPPAAATTLEVAVLYLALGLQSLRQHARPVAEALNAGELECARRRVGRIVSRDTSAMQPVDVARAAVESVLENGNDAVFGALFWFAIGGAPGALLYRLVNTLDAMWGYRTPRYRHFGWVAARSDDVMNFLPARLTALSYALLGHCGNALHCWRTQGPHWESPNAGPVMAAGAGSLGLELGGPAFYHGQWKLRVPLGRGAQPRAGDIARALSLVDRSVFLWVCLLLACCLARVALSR